MDAEMDIRRKKIDAKKRREELKEEEINRRQPTQGRGWTAPDRKMEYPEEVNNKKVKRRHKESRHEEDEDCTKSSRTVRKVRNGEVITPRKAAMDRESEAITSKLRKSDDKVVLRSVEYWDPSSNVWKQLACLPFAVRYKYQNSKIKKRP